MTTVRFAENGLTVHAVDNHTTVRFPACPTVEVGQVLNNYPAYPNDTAARAAGLLTHDFYWFSVDTDAGIYDTLKRVSAP